MEIDVDSQEEDDEMSHGHYADRHLHERDTIGHSESDGDTAVSPTMGAELDRHPKAYIDKPTLTSKSTRCNTFMVYRFDGAPPI